MYEKSEVYSIMFKMFYYITLNITELHKMTLLCTTTVQLTV